MPRFRHGLLNFVERRPGTYRTVEAGPRNRRAPALWELVGAAGGRSAVVSWFGSFPAEEIAGHYVSKGFDPENPGPNQTWPPELGAELEAELRRRIVMRRGDLETIGGTEFLRDTLIADARTLAAMRALAARERHDLLAVYIAGPDVAQHVTWGHMDPASRAFDDGPPPDRRLAQAIPGYYAFVDAALAEILELAGPDGTVVVVSDHGAGPLRAERAFHLQLEVLLGAMGLTGPDGAGPLIAIGELYRHEKRIWVNQERVEPKGVVPSAEVKDVARRTAERLRAMRTGDGDPLFAAVENRAAADDWTPGTPALVVRFADAALTAAVAVDPEVGEIDFAPVRLRHTDVSGGHRLEGIALFHGRDVRPGPLAPASIYRIAPTVLHLLGLPQDRRMLAVQPADGGVWTEALSPDLLRDFPVRAVPAYPGTDRSKLDAAWDAENPAEEEQLERLRGLGYVR